MALSFTHLIGPTCVGKGFILKLHRRSMANFPVRIGVISIGGRVKHLLDNDAAFRRKYAASIGAGRLLPDEEVIRIFNLEVESLQGNVDCVLVDGFLRSIEQTEYAIENGFLNDGDGAVVIDADNDVCLRRFLERVKGVEGQHRIDNEIPTFQYRYKLFRDTIGPISALVKESEADFVKVDGNQDIAEFVFPNIQNALWPQFMRIAERAKQTA